MLRSIMLLLISLYSCTNAKEFKQERKLEGNWVPAKIEWKSAVEGDPELEKVKYSSFYIFSFKKSEFIFAASTNTLANDSLVLVVEPGYKLFYGKWKMQDSLIIAEHKMVYSFFNFPGDTLLKDRTDTFILRNDFLIFKNEIYKPFSKIDTNRINSFWKQAKEVK